MYGDNNQGEIDISSFRTKYFALFAEGFENRNTTWICATIHYVNFLDFQLNYKKLFCIGNTSKYWCIQMTKERKIVTQEFFLFPFFRFLTTWYFVLRVCLFSRKVREEGERKCRKRGKMDFCVCWSEMTSKNTPARFLKSFMQKKRKGITLHCFSFFLYLLHWTQTIYFNFNAIKSMKENISKLLWELYPNQIPGRKITFFHFSFTSLHFHILPKKWTSSISRKKK